MGNAQSVPVLSEVVTTVDVATRLVVGGAAVMVGKPHVADDVAEGIGQSIQGYKDKHLIVGTARAMVSSEGEAERIRNVRNQAAIGFVEGVPLLGHTMAGMYALSGDEESASRAFKNATRSSAVIAAASVSGGLAPLVGATTGSAYDETVSSVTGKKYGTVALNQRAQESGSVNDAVTVFLATTSDAVVGKIAGDGCKVQPPAECVSPDVMTIIAYINRIGPTCIVLTKAIVFLKKLGAEYPSLAPMVTQIVSCSYLGLIVLAALALIQLLEGVLDELPKFIDSMKENLSILFKESTDLQKKLSAAFTLYSAFDRAAKVKQLFVGVKQLVDDIILGLVKLKVLPYKYLKERHFSDCKCCVCIMLGTISALMTQLNL